MVYGPVVIGPFDTNIKVMGDWYMIQVKYKVRTILNRRGLKKIW